MNPTPAGELWNILKTMCKISGTEDETAMKRMMNLALMDISVQYPFSILKRQKTLTFAATDTSGLVFPANAAGIYRVIDSDGNVYRARQVDSLRSDEKMYRWYYEQPQATELATVSNITILRGTMNVTGGVFTSSQIGEYVQIGSSQGLYLITSTTAISPSFRGLEDARSVTGYVRPMGTPKVAIMDYDSENNAATTTWYYWIYPYPLTEDWHLNPLPTSDVLLLRAAIMYWGDYKGEHDEADRFAARYRKALSECKAADPQDIGTWVPTDAQGNRMVLGKRK